MKKLESFLLEKSDMIEDLEMARFNMEERMAKEQSQMQGEIDKYRRDRQEIEERLAKTKKEFEIVEIQFFEKDELAKKLEEENMIYQEQFKMFIERLEELGENKSNIM